MKKSLILFILPLLFVLTVPPAYAQEYGSIKVMPPTEDCEVFIDGIQLGSGSISTKIKEGMHNVIVNLKDGTPLYSKQVEVIAKEVVTINVSYELKKNKGSKKIFESPFDKEPAQQNISKRFTIKGLYSFGPTIHKEAKISNYDGSGFSVKDSGDSSVDGGLGIGFEAEMFKLSDNIDIIAGFSYNLAKKVTHTSGRLTSAGLGSASYSGDVDDGQVAINSLYGKARYMFSTSGGSALPYVSAKLAYNIPSISGDNFDGYSVENGFGYGLSCGAILNDVWDIEFCADYIDIPMKEDLWYWDGANWHVDTLSGNYTTWLTTISVGHKF